jgi:hypothetical protein
MPHCRTCTCAALEKYEQHPVMKAVHAIAGRGGLVFVCGRHHREECSRVGKEIECKTIGFSPDRDCDMCLKEANHAVQE